MQAFGETMAVFRGEDGVVHVTDAYCPHIGANMAVGGVVKGSCLECPFHGWLFRGTDGACVDIPYTAKGKNSLKVTRFLFYFAMMTFSLIVLFVFCTV